MAARQPTAHLPHLQPSPRRAGAAAAYVLWWLSESIDFADTAGCWVWTGAITGKGYGILHLKNYDFPQRTVQAHRLVYTVCVEPVPDGLHVLHRCDNPPCCRPDHLFLGTDADNVADKVAKGRQLKGERITGARLRAAQIPDIRQRLANHEPMHRIAADYGVHRVTIHDIAAGKTWRHVV
jgi:hypothetical protein